MTKKFTTEQFINKAKKTHNDKYDYSYVNYIDSHTKVSIKCNNCKIIFQQLSSGHLRGYGCKNCHRTTKYFINKAKEIHNDKYNYDLTNYISAKEKVQIKCNTCNIIFEQTPDGHLHTSGCLNCENKSRSLTIIQFINKAKLIHKDKYNYTHVEYTNSNNIIKIICNKCKKIFEQKANSHLMGRGCPQCNFSKGESKCEEILQNIQTVKEIIPQFRYDDCRNKNTLPFDFKVN